VKVKYQIKDLRELQQWSVDHSDQFWSEVWDFFGVLGEKGDRTEIPSKLPEANYFPDAMLSHLENLLAGGGEVSVVKEADIENIGESLSHKELVNMASALINTFNKLHWRVLELEQQLLPHLQSLVLMRSCHVFLNSNQQS
jgi:acetoacetyl-CoA synthetase